MIFTLLPHLHIPLRSCTECKFQRIVSSLRKEKRGIQGWSGRICSLRGKDCQLERVRIFVQIYQGYQWLSKEHRFYLGIGHIPLYQCVKLVQRSVWFLQVYHKRAFFFWIPNCWIIISMNKSVLSWTANNKMCKPGHEVEGKEVANGRRLKTSFKFLILLNYAKILILS